MIQLIVCAIALLGITMQAPLDTKGDALVAVCLFAFIVQCILY